MSALDPRVYVACLSCYNAGKLHGEWFDATDELPGEVAEHFQLPVDEDGDTGPAPCGGEEFVVHDHAGFGAYDPGECSVSEAADIGQALRDADDNGEMLAALADHLGQAPQDISCPEDYYAGEAKDLATWAEDFHENLGDLKGVPASLRYHIDWDGVARDLELGGDVFTVEHDGGVWVFWNR